MQYDTFELDKENQGLCTIIMPFGNHKYARLLMGLKCSPNIAQAIMESTLAVGRHQRCKCLHWWNKCIFQGLESPCRAFSRHLTIYVRMVSPLSHWSMNGPSQGQTDSVLGSLQEVLNLGKRKPKLSCTWIAPAMRLNWVCSLDAFISTVTCGQIVLKPLFDHSGWKKKAPIPWTDDMQEAFHKMLVLMAADSLAAYPDHSERYDIYTDASDFQLGAWNVQEGQPVA